MAVNSTGCMQSVCDNADYFHGHIDETLVELGLSKSKDTQGRPTVKSRDIIDIVEGYKGRGYGLSTDEELGKYSVTLCSGVKVIQIVFFLTPVQLVEISSQTGIVLDPVYTLKGVRGMLIELKMNPKRFKGNRILYIHTGMFFML